MISTYCWNCVRRTKAMRRWRRRRQRSGNRLGLALDDFELKILMSGAQDTHNAFVTIHAGAGGAEACDWADMLYRMFVRWAERDGFKVEVVDVQEEDPAGIRSATLRIVGEYAFRLPEERNRRPPIGAHQSVRFPEAASHFLCERGRHPGSGRRHQHRTQRSGRGTRNLPIRAARGGRMSTKWKRRCGCTTSRPGWWWPARLSAPRGETANWP